MPDQISSFEHAAIEEDIKRLSEEIGRHRELPESTNLNEKELLRRAIKALPPVAQKQGESQKRGQPGKSPLPAYADDAPAEIKLEIEYLLDMAFHSGFMKALSEAKKFPEFVEDAFHDAFAKKLYPLLQERSVLK